MLLSKSMLLLTFCCIEGNYLINLISWNWEIFPEDYHALSLSTLFKDIKSVPCRGFSGKTLQLFNIWSNMYPLRMLHKSHLNPEIRLMDLNNVNISSLYIPNLLSGIINCLPNEVDEIPW